MNREEFQSQIAAIRDGKGEPADAMREMEILALESLFEMISAEGHNVSKRWALKQVLDRTMPTNAGIAPKGAKDGPGALAEKLARKTAALTRRQPKRQEGSDGSGKTE